jgi:hypothetical protein
MCADRKSLIFKQLRKSLAGDDSLIVCILAKLALSEDGGLNYVASNKFHSLCEIVDNFNTHQCPELQGKPKLFFFLDEGTDSDYTKIVHQEDVRATFLKKPF